MVVKSNVFPRCTYWTSFPGNPVGWSQFFAAPPVEGMNFAAAGGVIPSLKENAWLIFIDQNQKKASLFIRLREGVFEAYLFMEADAALESSVDWRFLEGSPGKTWEWIQKGGTGERPVTTYENLPSVLKDGYRYYMENNSKQPVMLAIGAAVGYGAYRLLRRR